MKIVQLLSNKNVPIFYLIMIETSSGGEDLSLAETKNKFVRVGNLFARGESRASPPVNFSHWASVDADGQDH